MQNSKAMEIAEDASIAFHELHDSLEELKGRFDDVFAAIDSVEERDLQLEAKFKKCSWELACALGASQEAADLLDEAYDLLEENGG